MRGRTPCMWTNDVNVELVYKAPIQLMNEAGLVIAAPARIGRCQDQKSSPDRG